MSFGLGMKLSLKRSKMDKPTSKTTDTKDNGLVPAANSEDNLKQEYNAPKEDVVGSDVQATSKMDGKHEVTSLNDLINSLNQLNSQSSVYGDKPVTLGGKKITAVEFNEKELKLVGTK